jgi:orotidine-5'-phosphate decarboxylase
LIIDRLYEEVNKKGSICLGLDTDISYIPDKLKKKYDSVSELLFQFNRTVIDETLDLVPIYKVQIAFYEAYGIEGMKAYRDTLRYIRNNKSMVIGDVKRGDISSTGKMYAKAHFSGDFECDFITVNPYMGMDSIEPYLEYVQEANKGLFVLLRTSNKGAEDIQYLNVKGYKVYNWVGDKIKEIAGNYMGRCGYSSVGVVVGATHTDEGANLRKRYENMFFLIPGYGAQGGKGREAALYLKNGNGGIVNSSRGIIADYKNYEDGEERFEYYVRQAVLLMKEDIRNG